MNSTEKIPLARAGIVLLRPVFQEEARPFDSLGLTAKVEAALQEATVRGDNPAATSAPLVYWDVAEASEGYLLGGRYKTAPNGAVTVTVSLYQGTKEVGAFPVNGVASDPDGLAARILAGARAHLK